MSVTEQQFVSQQTKFDDRHARTIGKSMANPFARSDGRTTVILEHVIEPVIDTCPNGGASRACCSGVRPKDVAIDQFKLHGRLEATRPPCNLLRTDVRSPIRVLSVSSGRSASLR